MRAETVIEPLCFRHFVAAEPVFTTEPTDTGLRRDQQIAGMTCSRGLAATFTVTMIETLALTCDLVTHLATQAAPRHRYLTHLDPPDKTSTKKT